MLQDKNSDFWNHEPPNGSFHHARYPHVLSAKVLVKIRRLELSRWGEGLAASLAEMAGWRTVYRGLRHRGFELDLVIEREGLIKIVEVKTLRAGALTPDLELVTLWMNPRKRTALNRGAQFVLEKLANRGISADQLGCDLVAVILDLDGSAQAFRWPNACELT